MQLGDVNQSVHAGRTDGGLDDRKRGSVTDCPLSLVPFLHSPTLLHPPSQVLYELTVFFCGCGLFRNGFVDGTAGGHVRKCESPVVTV